MHFKDEGIPKVQVAFQRGEVKVMDESQLMSEKARNVQRCVFFVSGWECILLYLTFNRCTFYLQRRMECF